MKRLQSIRSKATTNIVTLPEGVNTYGFAGSITFREKRIVEQWARVVREPRCGSRAPQL